MAASSGGALLAGGWKVRQAGQAAGVAVEVAGEFEAAGAERFGEVRRLRGCGVASLRREAGRSSFHAA